MLKENNKGALISSRSMQQEIIEQHTVPPLSDRARLQDYGVGIFVSAATKSALKKAIKKGFVQVNGAAATTATFLQGGENITLTIPAETTPRRVFDLPLEVLYEDEHLAVIEKPPGVQVTGNRFRTIVNALPQNLRWSTMPDAVKPHPTHRLDFGTTGVLLIGKTSTCTRALNQLFKEKRVEKTYYAITIGKMEAQGEITAPVDERPSESRYEVRASVPSSRFGQLNLVKLYPKTGRRHQLRKHLSGIGHPILGDPDYGMEGLILRGKGMYLHAYSLRLVHPVTEEEVIFESPLPNKFGKIFQEGIEP
jgi:23S rRNA pseudouridine1911/1915/1917 synthase